MKAAVLQFAPDYLAVDENRGRVERLLQSVEADLIVLPELFPSGYFFRSPQDLEQVAEPVPEGPTTQRLLDWSASLDATLVAGLAERDGSALYNSAVVTTPDGDTHRYRKVHLFYEETTLFTPGDLGFPVFDVDPGDGPSYRLGVMVCFDWYFPEAARSLALRGADVIAHPSNLVLPHCPDSMPIRARENHVYTLTANRHGTEQKGDETLTFIGMSEICGPDGDILARAGREETTVETAVLDLAAGRDTAINRYNDVLDDRRPQSYVTDRVD
jgi:predicted amidohydrolase